MTLYKNIEHLHIGLFRLVVLIFVIPSFSFAQDITVKPVNVNDFDESSFAPTVNNGWLYFSSNKKRNSIYSIQTEDGDNFFDLYKVEIKERNKVRSKTIPLSDSINRKFNETSSCINGNKIYFSSNSFAEVKKKRIGNYGIYIAELDSNEESVIKPFKYNDKRFNVAHPTVNDKGDILVFSSDNIAGEGMSDLYFCKLEGDDWSAPQNLGMNINTEDMETFPKLIGSSLFFASDRKGGLGGLDVYVSNFNGKFWTKPKGLPAPLNSKYDDFGYVANPDLKSGYFSSNRAKKKDGIFYFEYNMPIVQDFYQQELYFCYSLEEAEMEETDSLKFKWDLGNGEEANGNKIDYCYSDTGTYEVSMSILDKHTGTLFEGVSSYEIIIDAFNKPVIDLEDIKPGVVKVFVNKKWTNLNYTDMYWIVEGNYVFENDLTLKFKNKTELNVKLVVWDRDKPGSEIGIERVVYK